MKPIVLFVDDETNLLSGLKRSTRKFKSSWDMHFAASGVEALEIIGTEPINTIVTDVRMPGMSGVELLERVTEQWPGIFKLALSGEADEESVSRLIGISHRFLSKPCDPEELFGLIQCAFGFGTDFMGRDTARTWTFFDRLEATEGTFERLNAALAREEIDKKEIYSIILCDPSLSARFLQIANSAYFGRPLNSFDIETSLKTLGVDRVRTLTQLDRLGTEGPAVTHPVTFALAARKQVADAELGADVQSLGYASALFMNLGCDCAWDDLLESNTTPIYIASLFGFPSELIACMEQFQARRSQAKSPEELPKIAADVAILTLGAAA